MRAGMSISMRSPSCTRPIRPPSAASGETWPIERPEEPPEKRPSVISAQALPRPFDFSSSWVEHLLHAGAAARALIDDHDDVAGLDPVGQDRLDRGVLALQHARRTCEFEDAGIDAGRLHDAAVGGDVAVEHGEAAVPGIGVRGVADAPWLRSSSSSSNLRSWLNATCVGTPPGAAM